MYKMELISKVRLSKLLVSF